MFKKPPWVYNYKPNNVTIIRLMSRNAIDFIRSYLTWYDTKTHTVGLKRRNGLDKEFYIGFLRGLIDTDGYISVNRAVFSTISSRLAKDITYALKKLNIIHRIHLQEDRRSNVRPIYRITINRDLDRFIYFAKPNRFSYEGT
jgi:intein/homing endonuclease